ncbi:hypothetical protein UFOVP276_57 [uncultured Caudovirales phage]|uniref:Uncharacterized protein n=1 Tax=uncultured Caudovirales phage TaxID=2100421 RepID=A0A6J5LKF4_9CAUD|nr:hypothetical protein UFOVP127_194 [uncultured Caudovirales phage]CAB4135058.1 hypothetical protein UFOVP276_57 [uncultured Caudovirales phage]
MHISLQAMVATALAEADEREKLAAADGDAVANGEDTDINDGKGKEPSAANASPNNPATVPERNETSKADGEKTSMVANKLASAIEYLNENWLSKVAVGEITPPTPAGQPEAKIGPGEGPGAFETNEKSPTPGVQSEAVGQAQTGVIPMKPGTDSASTGQTNTDTAMETTINTPPGGSEDWTKKDVLKQAAAALLTKKAADKKVARVLQIIKSAEDFSPAVLESDQSGPALPGPAASQEKLIDSIQAAINYTKRDAKAEPKERMGEVLSEPAQKKTTDTVLQNNLSNTDVAGVKISSAKVAAARAYLSKVAEEGCGSDASPEAKEKADRLKSIVEAKQKEKSSGFDASKETF